jgi:hypothetical protein
LPSSEGLPIGYLNLTSPVDFSEVAISYSDFDTFWRRPIRAAEFTRRLIIKK